MLHIGAEIYLLQKKINVTHIYRAHTHICIYYVKNVCIHTGLSNYLLKRKKYLRRARPRWLKIKIHISTAKPVFRQKYAFCVRYSRDNVASLSRGGIPQPIDQRQTSRDRRQISGPNDRNLRRIDQHLHSIMHLALLIVFVKRLSRSREVLGFSARSSPEEYKLTTGCVNFVRRRSRSGMLMGSGNIYPFAINVSFPTPKCADVNLAMRIDDGRTDLAIHSLRRDRHSAM